ncbi:MAG: 3-dehydroquinate synthase [Atopobiaceae bacterium]|nr:3-dehydroquinate synthase [Atopobiaceae bacterium]
MNETIVRVDTTSRSYDVHVGRGLLESAGPVCSQAVVGRVAAIISDSNVAPLYAHAVCQSLEASGFETTVLTFPAGERNKRFATLESLLEGLAQAELSRDDVVIALGGGITGDMGGLAAALYLRGIHVVQIPTSLLAMVDSSVGGKTAVDLPQGKNLAGAFFQPSAVIADIDCLSTLSHELFTDSCGEVIKHGVLADPALFDELGASPINAEGYPPDELVRIVARNIQIKRDVVNADETERGLRQTLNLGHTLGHAIEAASEYRLGHGSSVAAGLCCIARASAKKGWCSQDTAKRIVEVTEAFGLPTDTNVDHETILSYACHDKKRHAGTVNAIIPCEIGRVEIRKLTIDELASLIELGCGTSDKQA